MIKKGFLVLIAVLFLITECKEGKVDAAQKAQVLTQSTVYYFHSKARCMSCRKIEKYATEVFNENFKDKLDLKIVNADESINKHFLEDYQLYSNSLVLVKIRDGKEIGFKNLDKIWNYLRDKEKFKSYVKQEIEAFLLTKTSAGIHNNIEVYHFSYEPFGITCKKAEAYIKNVIKNDFKDISFKSVNIHSKKPESFIKNYHEAEKNVVIFNKNKNRSIISSVRALIKQGKSQEEIAKVFISELKSMM